MCLLRPFLMQEEANAAYIEQQGFGKVLWDKGKEASEVLSLLRDPEALEDMKQRMAVALRSLDQTTPLDRFAETRRLYVDSAFFGGGTGRRELCLSPLHLAKDAAPDGAEKPLAGRDTVSYV